MDEVLVVIQQDLRNLEGVIQITHSDEEQGTVDSSAPLAPVLGACQLVQDIARLIKQVAADYLVTANINQLPRVDSVRVLQIEVVKFFLRLSGVFFRSACLPIILRPPALTS